MAEQSPWANAPALGAILTKMVELYTRAVRVDIERQKQANARLVTLLNTDEAK